MKDARGLKGPGRCWSCRLPGLLCYIELSLLSEPGTRQLENRYFISSMIYFTPLGRLGWGCHAVSRSCATLCLSEGSSGRILFTLTLWAGQSLHPVNFVSNLLSNSICFLLSKSYFLWWLSPKPFSEHLAFVHFRSFHFLTQRQILALLINLTLIWRNVLGWDTEGKIGGHNCLFRKCRDGCAFLCISSKHMRCLN